MKPIFLFILSSFVWIIDSNALVAQERFEIDDEGNIILLETNEPPKKQESPAQTPPNSTHSSTISTTPSDPSKTVKPNEGKIETSAPSLPPPNSEVKTQPRMEEQLKFPLQGVVTIKIGQLKVAPSEESRIVALLRQGDELELLEQQGNYFKARYMLEGQFPIEGWIIHDGLQVFKAGQKIEIPKAQEQAYEAPSQRPPVQTKAEELPEIQVSESVELPPDPSSEPALKASRPISTSNTISKTKKEKPAGSWIWNTGAAIGWTRYSESLETKVNGNAPEGSFLDYHLDGLKLEFTGGAHRAFNHFLGGVRGQYAFSFLSSSISSDHVQIESSSVLAQFHQVYVEAFAFRSWTWKKIKLEPEAGIGPQLQFFSVNQLREKRLAQPVLFSDLAFFLKASIVPKVYLPYHFQISPKLFLIFGYYFLEGPTQSTPAGEIRTGSPSITPFLFHYGLDLAWELNIFALENHFVKMSYLHEDYSRKFTGEGNRAGMIMEDASSSLGIHSLTLGYEHRF